jgi:hypothetical protein
MFGLSLLNPHFHLLGVACGSTQKCEKKGVFWGLSVWVLA